MNIWVGDKEGDGLLDELTKMWCFVYTHVLRDEWVVFGDKSQLSDEFIKKVDKDIHPTWYKLDDFADWLASDDVDGIAGHNFVDYDLRAVKKLGYIKEYTVGPDSINGKAIRIFDTLSMSRSLNPDRQLPDGCPKTVFNPNTGRMRPVGPHGLEAWGYRVSNKKPQVDSWTDQPLHVYIHRCIEDVKINKLVWHVLVKESKDTAKGKKGDWKAPLRLSLKDMDEFIKQEETGVLFNEEKAWRVVEMADNMMEELANEVEPLLPKRMLPKSQRPDFPSKPFKKNGEISRSGYNWLVHLGWQVDDEVLDMESLPKNGFSKNGDLTKGWLDYCLKKEIPEENHKSFVADCISRRDDPPIMGCMKHAKQQLIDKVMPDFMVPMKIGDNADVKKFLVDSEGWIPTEWRTKDCSRDPDTKKNYPKEVQQEKIEKYLDDLEENFYKDFIYEELGFKSSMTRDKKLELLTRKARYLPTTPKVKNDRGDLCPNLERINGELGKKIVKYLSLVNRRAVLKSKDETKTTGWLNHPRLKLDGRLPAGSSGYTNTFRHKHRIVVNVPKADPDVLLGKEFRSLFIASPGKKMIGFDASALESRVGGWKAYKYDNGEYAKFVLGDDFHVTMAKIYSKAAGITISRGGGKGCTYAITYGCSKEKLAKMLGISGIKAQKVIDAFWDTCWGLKKYKAALESYWESTGKKYILGIDGSKIYTRSKHSLLNADFQSTGAKVMTLAGCYMSKQIEKEQITDVNRLLFMHDEYQYEEPENRIILLDELPDDGRIYSNECGTYTNKETGEKEGTPYWYYSRIGELGVKSIRKAGEYFGSPVLIDAAYDVGDNWGDTH